MPRLPLPVVAARAERAVERRLALLLWRRGWRVRLVAYHGYGVAGPDGWARVLGRVALAPPGGTARDRPRGWRQFVGLNLAGVAVRVRAGDSETVVSSDVEGYLDTRLTTDLPQGWHHVSLHTDHGPAVTAPVRMVGPGETRGIVSDIDDTVMITALPRPFLAFWNTFVRHEAARLPVPGMAQLLHRVGDGEDPFVAYVSTGAWNVAPSLQRFLARHGYPPGPLLMTDWGPNEDRWFRSGRAHKRATLRRLLAELPDLTWTLVGDDGQHDPALYDELATEAPARVSLVLIRRLSAAEQVLTHGTPGTLPGEDVRASDPRRRGVPVLQGRDGWELIDRFVHR